MCESRGRVPLRRVVRGLLESSRLSAWHFHANDSCSTCARRKQHTTHNNNNNNNCEHLSDTHVQEVVFAVLLLDSTEFVRRQQSKSDVRRDFLGDYMHRLPEHDLQRYLVINSVRLLGDVKQYEGDALS